MVKIFISHSSKDIQAAKELVALLEKGIKIQSENIRCTSVPGYKLKAGAKIEQQLKHEVREAELVLGLVTPNSINSQYVLFELGARWALELKTFLIAGFGLSKNDLQPPLSLIHVLDANEKNDILQLIENCAEYLKLGLKSSSMYNDLVDTFCSMSLSRANGVEYAIKSDNPFVEERKGAVIRILSGKDVDNDGYMRIQDISVLLGMNTYVVKIVTNYLLDKGLIENNKHDPDFIRLTSKGLS